MRDFFEDMLIEPFRNGSLFEYLLGVVMWILFFVIGALLFMFAYWLIDSSFMPIKEKDGIVIGTKYSPPYTTTSYTKVGNVSVPNTTYHDESFYVVIDIDGLNDDVGVNEGYYNQTKKGDSLHCTYTNGRIGDNLYIKTISKK